MTPTRREVLGLMGSAAAAFAGARRTLAATASSELARESNTNPRLFAAFATEDRQSFGLGTVAEDQSRAWTCAIESRMHGGSVRPHSAEVVAVARRPGGFFLVVDARDGKVAKTVPAIEGRFFLGHAVFSSDGLWLFATEGVLQTGAGLVGVYDVAAGYRRTAEWVTGGSDPHELVLAADGASLWVANGGIELSSETGRAVLNESGIQSSLVRLDLAGQTADRFELDAELKSLSIRHIALAGNDGLVFACQEQGEVAAARPLLGRATRSGKAAILSATGAPWQTVNGYLGSIAVDTSGQVLVTTSPRGNRVWFQDIADPARHWQIVLDDVCGAAALDEPWRFLLTTGTGKVLDVRLAPGGPEIMSEISAAVHWDNHLIREARPRTPHDQAAADR